MERAANEVSPLPTKFEVSVIFTEVRKTCQQLGELHRVAVTKVSGSRRGHVTVQMTGPVSQTCGSVLVCCCPDWNFFAPNFLHLTAKLQSFNKHQSHFFQVFVCF